MTDEVAATTTSNADEVIQACLSEHKPQSFFLYAGAGSGKTGSLISALKWAQAVRRERLWFGGEPDRSHHLHKCGYKRGEGPFSV